MQFGHVGTPNFSIITFQKKSLINCHNTAGMVEAIQNWVCKLLMKPKKWVRKICNLLN